MYDSTYRGYLEQVRFIETGNTLVVATGWERGIIVK